MRDTSPRTAQLQLASALERLSDALDTLTFKYLITGRTADATATAQDAVIAQHQAVNIKRETHNVSLRISENPGPPNARLSLGDPSELARSLDTLALRLKAAGQPDLAETAAREADELRQQSETATITSYSARPTVRPSTSDDAQSALARRSRIPI